ncbi:MAG: hypothetical protein ACMG55_08780, partial [Microcoleus sp.]
MAAVAADAEKATAIATASIDVVFEFMFEDSLVLAIQACPDLRPGPTVRIPPNASSRTLTAALLLRVYSDDTSKLGSNTTKKPANWRAFRHC